MIALLVLQLGTGGCVFHAEQVDFVRAVEREDVRVTRGAGEILLSAAAIERRLQLRATQRETCNEHRVRHLVERTTKEVKLTGLGGGGGGGGGGGLGGLVIVAVVVVFVILPIGLITLIAAAAQSGTTEKRRVEESRRAFDCARPMANARALAQLPSGRVLATFTDHRGLASFAVPDDEPEGAVTLSVAAGGSPAIGLRFGAGVRASVPPGEGERCVATRSGRHRCMEGLVCHNETCVAPWRARPPSAAATAARRQGVAPARGAGAPCPMDRAPGAGDGCPAGSWCVEGHCVPIPATPPAPSSQPASRPVAPTPRIQARDSETPR